MQVATFRAASTTTAAAPPYPASVSGRKILDQNGDVYLMRTFSSWGMAQQLAPAEITAALEAVAANGFNAVTVWIGGGFDLGSRWNRYTNANGDGFWTGTPWASGLGEGWSSVDWIVQETARLGLTANLSFCERLWLRLGVGDRRRHVRRRRRDRNPLPGVSAHRVAHHVR